MSNIRIDVEGNLVADPRFKITNKGYDVCNFRILSTARIFDGQEGWRDGETTAFDVTVWGKAAEHVANRLHKGHRVQVTASRIVANAWTDRDGGTRSTIKITADRVSLVMNIDQTIDPSPTPEDI